MPREQGQIRFDSVQVQVDSIRFDKIKSMNKTCVRLYFWHRYYKSKTVIEVWQTNWLSWDLTWKKDFAGIVRKSRRSRRRRRPWRGVACQDGPCIDRSKDIQTTLNKRMISALETKKLYIAFWINCIYDLYYPKCTRINIFLKKKVLSGPLLLPPMLLVSQYQLCALSYPRW